MATTDATNYYNLLKATLVKAIGSTEEAEQLVEHFLGDVEKACAYSFVSMVHKINAPGMNIDSAYRKKKGFLRCCEI